MRIRTLSVFTLISMWLITACGGTSGDQQTAEAINGGYGTEFANIAASATVERDRLQVTVEFMQREILRMRDARENMIATLEGRGVPIQLPGVDLATRTPTPAPNANATVPGIVTTEEVSQPTTPTETALAVGLTNFIMSTGVQNDDCPINNTTQFSPETPEIYITAVANNIPAGTTVTSLWIRNNQELARYDFFPDFDIERACIWFYVDQTDFAFENGVYSVVLEVNGSREGEVTFTIAGTQ